MKISKPEMQNRGTQYHRKNWLGSLLPALLLGSLFAQAQSYRIDWFAVAGGGGISTGGVYSVSGTIGQGAAATTMTNGPYSLTGGFWSLPTAVQTPGAPKLSITLAEPGFARIAWTPSTPGFVLQESSNLSTTNWVNAVPGTNPVTVPVLEGRKFYRLFLPEIP